MRYEFFLVEVIQWWKMNMCESNWFGGRLVLILFIFYHIWYDDTQWHHFYHFWSFGLILYESIQLIPYQLKVPHRKWHHFCQFWLFGLIIYVDWKGINPSHPSLDYLSLYEIVNNQLVVSEETDYGNRYIGCGGLEKPFLVSHKGSSI